jgi:putative holliday junction resolvase
MARVLGIDYGTVRVGLALSDEMELVASPLATLQNHPELAEELARLVRSKHVRRVVVGAPFTLTGKAGSAMDRTEKFVTLLKRQLPDDVPVELVDERLSSKTAEATLKDQGHNIRAQDGIVDQLAATIILQDHLNASRGPDSYLLPDEVHEMPWLGESPRGGRSSGKRGR